MYKEIKRLLTDFYSTKSYSQEGEDLILTRLFETQREGFYVDIGAHHPHRFSNTYMFYKKGWKGINIDATPGSMKYFRQFRKRDINIECPIAIDNQKRIYYLFDEPALNTFSKELATQYSSTYKIINQVELTPSTLADILHSNLPIAHKIDFMSIDAEGYDLEILMSNDWSKYRPSVVLVEDQTADLTSMTENDIYKYMADKGYKLFAKTFYTVFYVEKGFI